MSNNCFYENCPMRINTTSSVYTCFRNNCQSRISSQEDILLDAMTASQATAYEDCIGCQHVEVCREAELKIAPCKHRLPHSAIDENRMRRVYQQVEEHGGIHHLIELDRLAWEGRLIILPKNPEKRKLVWQALDGVDLYDKEGV